MNTNTLEVENVALNCVIPKSLKEAYEEIAEKELRSLSNVVRIALENELKAMNERGTLLITE